MNIPLVPLRDVVIFPGVVTPLFVGRESSINSLQKAMSDDKSVMLIAQKEAISSLVDERNLLKLKPENPTPLNLKKYAHIQLLNENIPNLNIDISNICTYESDNNFYSWRRSKTPSRQWNFISP